VHSGAITNFLERTCFDKSLWIVLGTTGSDGGGSIPTDPEAVLSSGSGYLLPREKHKDSDCQLTMRLCCCSHASKDGRKTTCRMRKEKVSGVLSVLGPLWMMLLPAAEAMVDTGHGWVGTGSLLGKLRGSQSCGSQVWQRLQPLGKVSTGHLNRNGLSQP